MTVKFEWKNEVYDDFCIACLLGDVVMHRVWSLNHRALAWAINRLSMEDPYAYIKGEKGTG